MQATANGTPTETTSASAALQAKQDTLLSPRFYTTDFDAMDKIDVSSLRTEWDTMLAEYEGDNNHDHFQRTPEFAVEVAETFSKVSPELRQEFIEFLISSLTSEFSGCILYNEIQKNVTNPDIKALMRYMARDESRHASFINQSLKDFGLGLDLGDLKRTKAYTYFKPKYIFYATYLSEKIGYAATSPSSGSWSETPTSAFTRSSGGSSVGAMTSFAMANRLRSSCVLSRICSKG